MRDVGDEADTFDVEWRYPLKLERVGEYAADLSCVLCLLWAERAERAERTELVVDSLESCPADAVLWAESEVEISAASGMADPRADNLPRCPKYQIIPQCCPRARIHALTDAQQ